MKYLQDSSPLVTMHFVHGEVYQFTCSSILPPVHPELTDLRLCAKSESGRTILVNLKTGHTNNVLSKSGDTDSAYIHRPDIQLGFREG